MLVHQIARWLRDEEAAGSNPATPASSEAVYWVSMRPTPNRRQDDRILKMTGYYSHQPGWNGPHKEP